MTAAESTPPTESWAGDIVGGRYRLESPVGRGGMATVWRAVHLDLNRPVALKFLTIHGGDPEKVKDRFLREARIAAAVRHRNVVDITDFGTTDEGRPFMVMELLEGESLAERMGEDRLFDVAEVVRIGARALSGLGAVHDAGIVHRDLKPENVHLVRDADGMHTKILDFGISRSVQASLESVVPSSDNVLAGTPQYMSPEQARGLRDVDQRSDLWSMGVILYEMLTGILPFDSKHVGDLIMKIMSEEPTPVRALRPDLGEPLARMIDRALTRERDERFQTAREMRQALLNAATLTAKALRETGSPEATLQAKALMEAVGSAYEPGDSGMLDVVDARARPGAADEGARDPAETMEESGPVRVETSRADAQPRAHLRWIAVAAVALLAAAAIAVWLGGGAEGPGAASSAEQSAAGGEDLVTVTLRRLPEGAAVTVNGHREEAPAVALPRDGREHVIEVNAPGYEPWHVTHRADSDGAYDVQMRRLAGEGTGPEEGQDPDRIAPVRPGEMIRDPGF